MQKEFQKLKLLKFKELSLRRRKMKEKQLQ